MCVSVPDDGDRFGGVMLPRNFGALFHIMQWPFDL